MNKSLMRREVATSSGLVSRTNIRDGPREPVDLLAPLGTIKTRHPFCLLLHLPSRAFIKEQVTSKYVPGEHKIFHTKLPRILLGW